MDAFEEFKVRFSWFKNFGKEKHELHLRKPVNVIIGRNNSGKTALLDLINVITSVHIKYIPVLFNSSGNISKIYVEKKLNVSEINSVFGYQIDSYGEKTRETLIGESVIGSDFEVEIRIEDGQQFCNKGIEINNSNLDEVSDWNKDLANSFKIPFSGFNFIKIQSERRVSVEIRDVNAYLLENGDGVTNSIRCFLNQDKYNRNIVERDILSDLNSIYKSDLEFSRISVVENDSGQWEILLSQAGKGDVRISQSGSSLQSIMIIISYINIIKHIKNIDWKKTIFAIEEIENNLHPSLLRSLLEYVYRKRNELGFVLFLTTHSPVCIDWTAKKEDADLHHVKVSHESSSIGNSQKYLDYIRVLDDLTVRASDILQANSIIWVEGPSDRVYINKAIELISLGSLSEGYDYQIMFYGGKLLSHLYFAEPSTTAEQIHVLNINRNSMLVMDSDRHEGGKPRKNGNLTKPRMKLNTTKRRILNEFSHLRNPFYVTEGRQIENCITDDCYSKILERKIKFGLYEDIVGHRAMAEFKEDKIRIAERVCSELNSDNFYKYTTKDFRDAINKFVDFIKRSSLNE